MLNMVFSCMTNPQCVQYTISCSGSWSISVCLHSGHTVLICLKFCGFILGHIHSIVRTFRKCVVLFFQLRFLLFRFLVRHLGLVLVLCILFRLVFCVVFGGFCSSIGCCICVFFLVLRVFYRFRCSRFVGYVF